MADTYKRVNWEDSPSIQTPISARNLNIMDKGIDDAHIKASELETNKIDKPSTGKVGQALVVAAVDGNGKPTGFKLVDMNNGTSGGTSSGTQTAIAVDSALSKTSANPVQNKVVAKKFEEIESKLPVGDGEVVSGVTVAQATSLWAILQKATFTEALTDEEISAFERAWLNTTSEDNTDPDDGNDGGNTGGTDEGGNGGTEETTHTWKKYAVEQSNDVIREKLDTTTRPSDAVIGDDNLWRKSYAIGDDDKFHLSEEKQALSGYCFVDGTDGASIYEAEWNYVYQGTSYTYYYKLTITSVTAKGEELGTVTSNNDNEYPSNGILDCYWYVKV